MRASKHPLPVSRFTLLLDAALQHAPVPLLALHLPQFQRVAWQNGKRPAQRLERSTTQAFLDAADAALRTGDLLAHDRGSDLYAIAMTAASRRGRLPAPIDVRAALHRVALAVSSSAGLRVETGWTLVRVPAQAQDIEREIACALERGARERERYEFFSAVGHELRTPLTSIRGYLETLLESSPDAPSARGFLETARREALRMGRLLDGMFEFSLLDLSTDALLGGTCDLERQIELACEVVCPLARQRHMRVHRKPIAAALIALDADACLQLLVNLLENAIKYGRDGGAVEISVHRAGDDAVICVDDDGPGIAPAEREWIFGLRSRGMQAHRRPGAGIGLAIVKTIAERAGGCVRASDSPLGGARLEALLPLRAESALPMS